MLGGKCVKCGTTEKLEFDHIDPGTMSFRISGSNLERSERALIGELKKCQLLCAPCHLKKSIRERGGSEPTHGSLGMYTNHKCRCAPCLVAHRDSMRHYRRMKKALVIVQ